jgi:anti-sigma factor RsiW
MPPTRPDPVSWEALEALAAGELPAAQAAALRARLADDPALQARYARVERTEGLLRAEAVAQAPAGLADRILAGLPSRTAAATRPAGRLLRLRALSRLAAAVVLSLGAWLAVAGTTAPRAAAASPAVVGQALGPALQCLPHVEVDAAALPLSAPDAGGAGWWAAAGLVLLAGGVLLARRLSRGIPAPRSQP